MRVRWISETGVPLRQAFQRSPSASRRSRRAPRMLLSRKPTSTEPPADREVQAPDPLSPLNSPNRATRPSPDGQFLNRSPHTRRPGLLKWHPGQRPIHVIPVLERKGQLRRNEDVVHDNIMATRAPGRIAMCLKFCKTPLARTPFSFRVSPQPVLFWPPSSVVTMHSNGIQSASAQPDTSDHLPDTENRLVASQPALTGASSLQRADGCQRKALSEQHSRDSGSTDPAENCSMQSRQRKRLPKRALRRRRSLRTARPRVHRGSPARPIDTAPLR